MIDYVKRKTLLKLSTLLAAPLFPSFIAARVSQAGDDTLGSELGSKHVRRNSNNQFRLGDEPVQPFDAEKQSAYVTLCTPWQQVQRRGGLA